MAKSFFKKQVVTELLGLLDMYEQDKRMVVIVDGGKGAEPQEYDIVELLGNHLGEQITLKLVDEGAV